MVRNLNEEANKYCRIRIKYNRNLSTLQDHKMGYNLLFSIIAPSVGSGIFTHVTAQVSFCRHLCLSATAAKTHSILNSRNHCQWTYLCCHSFWIQYISFLEYKQKTLSISSIFLFYLVKGNRELGSVESTCKNFILWVRDPIGQETSQNIIFCNSKTSQPFATGKHRLCFQIVYTLSCV